MKTGWQGLKGQIQKTKAIMSLGRGSATCQAGVACNPVRFTRSSRIIKNSL